MKLTVFRNRNHFVTHFLTSIINIYYHLKYFFFIWDWFLIFMWNIEVVKRKILNCKIWYKSAVKHFKYMSRELQETLRQRQYLKGLKLMTLSWLNTTRKNRIWAVLRQLPRTFQRLIVDIWIFLGITWTFTVAS